MKHKSIITGGNCYRVIRRGGSYLIEIVGDDGTWSDFMGRQYSSSRSAVAAVKGGTK